MVASPVSTPVALGGAAWGEAATWRWRGLEVHWRRLGNPADPALVLVHGFGAASGHWRHNAGPLAAAGWCVYALDLVGFGHRAYLGLEDVDLLAQEALQRREVGVESGMQR